MSHVSPYTRVIEECLHSLSGEKEDGCECDTSQVMQLLINMLQGRMLEHIKERVSNYYKIEQNVLNEDFSVCLIEVFAEIFSLFRNKFEEMPWLVNEIAKRIVEAETRNGSKTERCINQLYLSIFCKYFEYKNIEKIISTLQSDPRIQSAIISANPSKTLTNSSQLQELSRNYVN